MELWACGFNAWNQLQFEGDLPDESEDIYTFKRVLTVKGSIQIIGTSFSACLGALGMIFLRCLFISIIVFVFLLHGHV